MENRQQVIENIRRIAKECNRPSLFVEDPIAFPRHFASLMKGIVLSDGYRVPKDYKVTLKDVEIAAVIAAHLAWGRRNMIVRDIGRAMDEMGWKPYKYVMEGKYRNGPESLHRTIRWSEFAMICGNLKRFYDCNSSLEILSPDEFRTRIYGQKEDRNCANKKIHMLRRWMVRRDGIVDLGLWKSISPKNLVIPLDVHVHQTALALGITERKSTDIRTALEITAFLKECFPEDPCLGDYALFAYPVSEQMKNRKKK
ncbi:MAG: DUF2400 domain-containing protein [Bacteroidales bacterium]|nr:DUF2400 domain-containing protein [Bacteroidales bacterium]